jgi:hypothetical protein
MTRALPSRGVVAAALVLALAVSGCATIPSGPSVMVLPGSSKNFEQFQMDDGLCRQWAAQQTGTTNDQATAGSTVQGTGTFIAPRAEFRPRNVQTADERSKLVYRVKVTVDNSAGVLKQGMPVDADFVLP